MNYLVLVGLLTLFAPLHVVATGCDSRYSVLNVSCTSNKDCSYHGECHSDGVCVCNNGYITFPSGSTIGCNYEQSAQLGTFLLSLFLGTTGADQFYIGHNDLGAGKIVTIFFPMSLACFILCCAPCCMADCVKGFRQSMEKCFSNERCGFICVCCSHCFIILWCFGSVAWLLHDIIVAGMCSQLDGNGAPLKSW